MNENKKCSMCGKDNATVEISHSGCDCRGENYVPPTKVTTTYICDECAKKYKDRLENYCNRAKIT